MNVAGNGTFIALIPPTTLTPFFILLVCAYNLKLWKPQGHNWEMRMIKEKRSAEEEAEAGRSIFFRNTSSLLEYELASDGSGSFFEGLAGSASASANGALSPEPDSQLLLCVCVCVSCTFWHAVCGLPVCVLHAEFHVNSF